MKKILTLAAILLFVSAGHAQPQGSALIIRQPTAGGGGGNIAFGGVTVDGVSGLGNCSVVAPTITGSDKVLLLAVAVNGGPEDAPSAATYNGVSVLGSQVATLRVNQTRVTVYAVVNPVSAATFSETTSGSSACVVIAAYYTGVNQSTPYRTATTASGTGVPPATADVTNSQSGDVIAGFFGTNDTTRADGFCYTGQQDCAAPNENGLGAGQTFRVTFTEPGAESQMAFCDEPGASGTVGHSWSFVNNANNGWVVIAIPLIPS